MTFNIYFGILATVILFVGYCYWRLLPVPLSNGIPYNTTSARRILGDLGDIKAYAAKTGEFSPAVFAIAQKLQSPIAQLLHTSLAPPTFVIDDPREAEDIIFRRGREFDRSTLSTNFFKHILPYSTIAQLTTPELKAQKRLWSDAMSYDFLRRVVAPNMRLSTLELVELWRTKSAQNQPFEVLHDFGNTVVDAMWVAILGSHLGLIRQDANTLQGTKASDLEMQRLSVGTLMRESVEHMTGIAEKGSASLWPKLIVPLLQSSPKSKRLRKALDGEIHRLMDAAVERFQRINAVDALSEGEDLDTCAMDLVLRRKVVAAKKAGQPTPRLTEDPAIYQELLLLLVAGFDSTSHTLSWFVKFASTNPGPQETLRRVLKASFPGPSPPSSAEILDTKIPYLDAFIEETIRLSATTGVIARKATTDAEILGYRIPAGSNLVINTRYSHPLSRVPESLRSKSSQAAQEKRVRGGLDGESGKDLDLFEPRRWLTQDAAGNDIFDPNSLPRLVFGGGLRGCFGQKLAMQALRTLITLLALSFEFLPVPQELSSMKAVEKVFRQPKMAYVKL